MTRRYKEVGRVKSVSACPSVHGREEPGTILQAMCAIKLKSLTQFNESIESAMRLLCHRGEKGEMRESCSEAMIGPEVRGSALRSASS